MDRLFFGISGIPHGDGKIKLTYKSAIAYLKHLGLDAMELPFVRSINVTERTPVLTMAQRAKKITFPYGKVILTIFPV